MASGPSNFDAEIKKGMTGASQKKSDSGVSSAQSKSSGKFNQTPKASPPQAADHSGDTHQAMVNAGNAHMAAIHAHINKMAGC